MKMARVALDLKLTEIAKLANCSPNTISRLERGEELKSTTLKVIREALEQAGVEFLDPNGKGAGVRLVKSKETNND